MNRKQADIAVGIVVVGILLVGVISVIQLHLTGGPMSSEMDSVPVMAVIGPLFMSLLIASIVGGVYVFVRSKVFETQTGDPIRTGESHEPEDGPDTTDATESTTGETTETEQSEPEAGHTLLDVLPDDERRILEPVIESPGLTQTKIRDRSGFSRSKVSQTVTDLEDRGLLYRESQGRTYRVYPADDIDDRL
jgi:uncharacterized membrane protein